MSAAEMHARRRKILGILWLSLITIGVDTTILNIALPTLQWMVDSYLLVFSGLLLVFERLRQPACTREVPGDQSAEMKSRLQVI
jgi:hypothetical protein